MLTTRVNQSIRLLRMRFV